MKINIDNIEKFDSRHLGPDNQQVEEMLNEIGASSLEDLILQTIPQDILLKEPLSLPNGKSEYDFIKDFRALASKNKVFKSYIGLGYYGTVTPPVILRNILENPGWYTAYTPYQAEIAQGRLEALLNFQTMVMDLTGMEIANASLLDEGTAAAEAMFMLYNVRKASKKAANVYLVSDACFPQTIDILKTRSTPLGIKVLKPDQHLLESRLKLEILENLM
jgi:glycine dehydrogenase